MVTMNDSNGSSIEANQLKTSESPEASANKAIDDGSIDPENEMTGIRLVIVHAAICMCTFLVGLDFNIIATAIPVITSDFDSIEDVGWYGAALYLTLCATQPLTGKTFVLFPKKWMYLFYLGIFEIGCLVCAVSPNSATLIGGRAIAGIGASGLFAGSMILITTIIPLYKRAIWQGSWSAVFSISSIVGPLIGGALTNNVNWRWCFWINLPIGGAAALLVLIFFHVKKAPSEDTSLKAKLRSMDGIGFCLFAGSITMLLLALQWGPQRSWNSATVIGLFVACGVTASLFAGWQMYLQDNALIPPRLFSNRNAALICVSAIFTTGPFLVIIYWLPIWFQAVLGVSPISSSVRYLPTVIADVLAAFVGGALVTKIGWWNPFLLFGDLALCLGGGLLSTLTPTIGDGNWIGYQIFGGIGYAWVMNMAHLGLQASIPPALVPIGATTLVAILSTSCAIFLALGQTIFEERLAINLPSSLPSFLKDQLSSIGATELRSMVNSDDIAAVISAYGKSVTQVFYLAAAAPAVSFILICFCRWTSLKKGQGNSAMGQEEQSSSSPARLSTDSKGKSEEQV